MHHRLARVRTLPRILLVTWTGACAVLPTSASDSQPAPPASSLREDAELKEIYFVDDQIGWVAGDRGTIWHTQDGGSTWRAQPTDLRETIHSVTFIDERRGWAVGGGVRPYGHATQGVVLSTGDGGQHWRRSGNQALLPTFDYVRFFDGNHGVAIGDSSPLFHAGVYLSSDRGMSWNPLADRSGSSWRAADFVDSQTGILVGDRLPVGRFHRQSVSPSRIPDIGLRSVRDVAIASPNNAWIVGDGGLVFQSNDGGETWHRPASSLPAHVTDWFDFHTVAARGTECWIAGTPGTYLFHSGDAGRSWSAYPTGQRLPMRSMVMRSGGKGWLVGAMGTILATRDGGRTWQRQRAPAKRAALLAILSEPDRIPLEVLAQLAGAEGYRAVVDIVSRPIRSASSARMPVASSHTHQAVVRVGGCCAETAWQFPLRPAELRLSQKTTFARLNRFHDGKARQRLEAYLVRQIRMWRPSLVMTHAGNAGDWPIDRLVADATQRAVLAAADPDQYSELITEAGLGPWSVDRVVGLLPPGETAALHVSTGKIVPRLGGSLADYAFLARGFIAEADRGVRPRFSFRTLMDRASSSGRRNGFFSGIRLVAGDGAQRALGAIPLENIEQLKRAAKRQRTVVELMRRARKNPAWLSQIGVLTEGLDATTAGTLLYRIGREDAAAGRFESADRLFQTLAATYPQHALVESALDWLIGYYASGEAARQAVGSAPDRPPVTGHSVTATPPNATANRRTSFSQPDLGKDSAATVRSQRHKARLRRAVQLGKELERTRPLLFADPAIRFPLYVAYRQLGEIKPARRILRTIRHAPNEAWSASARGETWLADRRDAAANRRPDDVERTVLHEPAIDRRTSPKKVYHCRLADTHPYLDGKLDEPLWQAAQIVELAAQGDDGPPCPAAEAQFSWDTEFLYLGLRCRKGATANYAPPTGLRPRDPDLSANDRIDLLIDIDRDYATFYRLTIDHRGWVGEAFLGDRTWNPTWYVGAASDGDSWTIEAAIELSELADPTPQAGTVWAIGLQRVLPGTGFQAWTSPADLQIAPEGFGYLSFE
ncbi:MAG: YCF48-related protein [Pirellulales bacterium]